jgi:uncharacterized delta-60 repeat protein
MFAAGDVDLAFGTDGIVVADVGGIDSASAVAVHADGRAVVVGISRTFDPDSTSFVIARFQSDGSPDVSFGTDGKTKTPFDESPQGPSDIAIQSDGKYIVVGDTTSEGNTNFVILRYTADGQLDSTFSEDGIVETDFSAYGVAIDVQGRIVVAGTGGGGFALARYLSDGNLDASFGTAGEVVTALDAATFGALDVALTADGKIVVGGSNYNSETTAREFAIARFNSDGTLDTGFDSDGWVTTTFSSVNDRLYSIDIQQDGKIVAAGGTGAPNSEAFAVARYHTDGSLDDSFGTAGRVTSNLTGGPDGAYGVRVTPAGQIVVAGVVDGPMSNDYGIVRYLSDGSLDPSFGTAGVAIHDFGLHEDVRAMALRPDGKILVVGGRFGGINNANFTLAQFLGDTVLDADRFEPNNNPLQATPLNGASEQVDDLSLHIASDQDFFRWEAQAGGVLLVTIDSEATTGDIDLAILDAQGALIAEARTAGNSERISMPVTAGAIHFFRVDGYADALLKYDLSTVLLPDTDGDGLPDQWEQHGVDLDFDGTVDYPLTGADPLRQDLFLEIDAMQGRGPLPLSTPLSEVQQAGLATGTVVDRVISEYLQAPTHNPDGTQGIRLHVEIDETNIPMSTFQQWSDFATLRDGVGDGPEGYFGTRLERETANWPTMAAAKRAVYRYGLFADRIRTTRVSGIAETPGTSFAITLGAWDTPGGTADEQAGTLMHELGHTLGLHHGGGDDVNFKPNYFSVMNYHWQVPRSQNVGWSLAYSPGLQPPLNESQLDESQGIGFAPEGPLAGNSVVVGPLPLAAQPLSGGVDWNRNGVIDQVPVAADINRGFADTNRDGLVNEMDNTHGEMLLDHDDWSALRFIFTGPADLRKYKDGVDVFPWQVEADPNDLYDDDPPDWFDQGDRRNNDQSNAYPLDQFDGFNLIADNSGKLDGVTLHDAQDVDWYRISSRLSGTMELVFSTTIGQANQPLRLNVSDSTGQLLGTSEHRAGAQPARITFDTDVAESYSVRVSGEGTGQGVYQLDFRLRPTVRTLADLEQLCEAVHLRQFDYDLDENGITDQADLQLAVSSLLLTGPGDANLDRVFNSTDLVLVFQAGEYEDTVDGNSTWSRGDWNCDGEFNTSDLVTAFQVGNYVASAVGTRGGAPRIARLPRASHMDKWAAAVGDRQAGPPVAVQPEGQWLNGSRMAEPMRRRAIMRDLVFSNWVSAEPLASAGDRSLIIVDDTASDSESHMGIDRRGPAMIASGGPDEASG